MAFPFGFDRKSIETETTTSSEFSHERKAIVEQILMSEEINKSMGWTVTVTVRDPSRKISHLSKVICDRKIITKFNKSISSTRDRFVSPLDGYQSLQRQTHQQMGKWREPHLC